MVKCDHIVKGYKEESDKTKKYIYLCKLLQCLKSFLNIEHLFFIIQCTYY